MKVWRACCAIGRCKNSRNIPIGPREEKQLNREVRKDDATFSRLFLPPEWALKQEEKQTASAKKKKTQNNEKTQGQQPKKKPATRKAPFRALRYTLFLLMGMQEDRYYGEAGDMRLFLLRLGLACGLSSDGLQRLLLEQKLPGIDFKTAPELILAYEADRSQQAAAQKDVPPIRTTAYAEAELLLRVYKLLIKTQPDKAPSEVRLESTRYMYNEYDKTVRIQGKNIPPRDFLAWMQGQNFPAYTVEQLLSGRYSGGKVVFCCMQLFHTMWFLSHINEVLLEKLSKRTQTRSPSVQRRKKAKREESRKKSAETRELVERLLQQMNNGFSVFRKEETAVCLQKLLDMLPDMQKEEKSHQSLLNFFFPDSDVQKLLLSFFPYDSEFYLESDSKSAPECDPLRNQEVLQLCRCVAERRLLERDDFFYLMFTDFLLTYGKAEDSETYVARFEQMYKETAEECRILPFCAEQEPQMATVFRRAANNYKKYVGNMVVEP